MTAQPAPAPAGRPADAEAQTLFDTATKLMAAGNIQEACKAFDASEKLTPTLNTLLNAAACHDQNGELATAWGMFVEAERETLGAADEESQKMNALAAELAKRIEPRLSKLTIEVPDASRIGGLEIRRGANVIEDGAWNVALPVDGGVYTISAQASGYERWTTTIVVAPEHDTKSVQVPPLSSRSRRAPMVPLVKGPPQLPSRSNLEV